MPDDFNLIADINELDRMLEQLPKKLRNKGARKATREAAKIVLEDARRLVPVDTGQLESSLKVRARKRSRRNKGTVGHSVTTSEGLFKGEEFYGGFIELGTSKFEGDPFLRPAIWGNQQRIRMKFVQILRDWFRTDAVKKR